MKFKDETALVEQLRSGNVEAYSHLLKKYHQRLYAYALSLIHDHAMAQDIVQNVFFNTWKFRERLDPKHAIKNFLFKTTYNEFLNTYNKNQSMMLLQEKYYKSLTEIAVAFEEDNLQQTIEKVNRAIEDLPEKCQKIFLMSKKEGLTNVEIADYMKVSVKAVEAQITKAFKLLKKELGKK